MSCPITIINPVGEIGEFFQVASKYGWRRHPVTNELSFHRGIDIPAKKGTIVRSAQDGIVVMAQNSGNAGNMIKIENQKKGLLTKYMHLNSFLVSQGQTVRAGDPIGTVGATGRVTGPHLHFEMFINGESIDPLECYQKSQRNNPYEPKKFNFIPYIIGSGVVLTSIIIYNNKK